MKTIIASLRHPHKVHSDVMVFIFSFDLDIKNKTNIKALDSSFIIAYVNIRKVIHLI